MNEREALDELRSSVGSLLATLNLISTLISTNTAVNWGQVAILIWQANSMWGNLLETAWVYDRHELRSTKDIKQ
jgi:hypothetical protein